MDDPTLEEAARAGRRGRERATRRLQRSDQAYYESLFWGVAYLAVTRPTFLPEEVWTALGCKKPPNDASRRAIGSVVKELADGGYIVRPGPTRAAALSHGQERKLWSLVTGRGAALKVYLEARGADRPIWLPKRKEATES